MDGISFFLIIAYKTTFYYSLTNFSKNQSTFFSVSLQNLTKMHKIKLYCIKNVLLRFNCFDFKKKNLKYSQGFKHATRVSLFKLVELAGFEPASESTDRSNFYKFSLWLF